MAYTDAQITEAAIKLSGADGYVYAPDSPYASEGYDLVTLTCGGGAISVARLQDYEARVRQTIEALED